MPNFPELDEGLKDRFFEKGYAGVYTEKLYDILKKNGLGGKNITTYKEFMDNRGNIHAEGIPLPDDEVMYKCLYPENNDTKSGSLSYSYDGGRKKSKARRTRKRSRRSRRSRK